MLRTLGGLGVSAVFLALAARHQEWGQFTQAVRQVSPGFLVLAACLTTGSYLLRGWRWQRLFPPPDVPTLGETFSAMLVGYAANNVLPARAGEVLRSHLLGRRLRISRARVLATVVLERAFDALSLVALFALAAPLLGHRLSHGREVLGLGVVLAVFLGGMFILWRRHHGRGTGETAPPDEPTFLGSRLRQFAHGFESLGSIRAAASLMGLSLVIWMIDTTSFWATMCAFPQVHVPWGAALSASVFGNLGTLIPAGPAGVGTFELAVREVVTPWGIDATTALAMAVVIHLLQFTLTTGAGAVAWIGWNSGDGVADGLAEPGARP